MTEAVEIRRTSEGFVISYQYWTKQFIATKGDVTIKAANEAELEILIKNHLREKRKFKPINVIHLNSERVGRITSRAADDENMVYFSFSEDGKKKHTKEILEGRYYYEEKDRPRFVLDTPANQKKLLMIENIKLRIRELQKDISKLWKEMSDPLTWEMIEEQGEE